MAEFMFALVLLFAFDFSLFELTFSSCVRMIMSAPRSSRNCSTLRSKKDTKCYNFMTEID